MNQEIVKETLDSEGNQTHFGKAITKIDINAKVNWHTMITGVAALDEEDYFTVNVINVQGTNKDGDIRIRANQNLVIKEDGFENVFQSTQNLVISREDAKSLIRTLTAYL